MKRFLSLLIGVVIGLLPCFGELTYSTFFTITHGDIGKGWYGLTGGVAPHLSYGVGYDDTTGCYMLIFEFDRASESSDTQAIPNGKLLIRTKDGTVISKTADYAETRDYVGTTPEESVSKIKNGALVTQTTASQQFHHFTAYYHYVVTPEEIKKMSDGILKIRLEANPIFEKEFKKDKMGKNIEKQYKAVNDYRKAHPKKAFEDNF